MNNKSFIFEKLRKNTTGNVFVRKTKAKKQSQIKGFK